MPSGTTREKPFFFSVDADRVCGSGAARAAISILRGALAGLRGR